MHNHLLVAMASGLAVAGMSWAAPVPTAGDRADVGVLSFRVTDGDGAAMPCRLTFLVEGAVDDAAARPDLFVNTGAAANELAMRRNAVYSMTGSGEITVPAGAYTVIASRGLEYAIATRRVTITAGGSAAFEAALVHEVDTSGWIGGDYHLHTLTYSGHGDSNMPERIISLAGEGVEFAVATDHNHRTDYAPTIAEVGAGRYMASVVGNEVSTPVGHFNAFPLDAGKPVDQHRFPSAQPIFALLREQTNGYGITPVIQVNHPRWADINYFGQAGLDPVLGVTASEVWSADFDTIEVFNENEGWGYYDPDETKIEIGSGTFSVLRDWSNLLNRGARYAAVGNSDSHDVTSEVAGVPRNYTPSPTDDPAKIDPRDVAAMLRARRVFTTTGPFVEFTVNGVGMGGEVALPKRAAVNDADKTGAAVAAEATVEARVRVQAATWIDVDRVKVVVNGDVVRVIEVPPSGGVVRLDETVTLAMPRDAWVCVLVEGDTPMAPVVHDQTRPIRPLAVVNPVWVDADGDGAWTSPWEWARGIVANARGERPLHGVLAMASPAERALVAQALGMAAPRYAANLVGPLLGDEDRYVRLSAARAAEMLELPALAGAVEAALAKASDDGLLSVALVRALAASGGGDINGLLGRLIDTGDVRLLGKYGEELSPLVKGRFVTAWQFAGYFPRAAEGDVLKVEFGPELDGGSGAQFAGAKGGEVGWRPIDADATGRVDLLSMAASAGEGAEAISYLQCWLVSPDDREVLFTLGSDDGARVWVNGAVVYEDFADRGASPMQHVGRVRLKAGANRVVFKVENGGGEHAAYFRVLDEAVGFSRTAP